MLTLIKQVTSNMLYRRPSSDLGVCTTLVVRTLY